MNSVMSPVLFLDFDGPVNVLAPPTGWYFRPWQDEYVTHTEAEAESFTVSPAMIQGLNVLLEQTNAELVLASSWGFLTRELAHCAGIVGGGQADFLDLNGTYEGNLWDKHAAVRDYLARPENRGRKAGWLEDELEPNHDAALWAAQNDVLAFAPTPRYSTTPAMIEQLRRHFIG